MLNTITRELLFKIHLYLNNPSYILFIQQCAYCIYILFSNEIIYDLQNIVNTRYFSLKWEYISLLGKILVLVLYLCNRSISLILWCSCAIIYISCLEKMSYMSWVYLERYSITFLYSSECSNNVCSELLLAKISDYPVSVARRFLK